MNATQAKKLTDDWHAKAKREHDAQYKASVAERKKQEAALWEKRSPALISQIEGYIRKAASQGHNGTYEPTQTNPNGDSIIYLDEADQPIKGC